MCTHTWFMSSATWRVARKARARRIPSTQFAIARSTCGQRTDVVVVVAHDGELAHLGHRDQPLVGLVVLGDAVVEQHVLGRVDARDVEVAQPPQVEPPTDHRVQPAHQVVLVQGAVARAQREVRDRRGRGQQTPTATRRTSCVNGIVRQSLEQRSGSIRPRRRRVGPCEVQVDDRLLARRACRDLVADRAAEAAVGVEFVEGRRLSRRDASDGRRARSRPPSTGRSSTCNECRSCSAYSR